jgi:uncharacterized protein (UPF0335 family)
MTNDFEKLTEIAKRIVKLEIEKQEVADIISDVYSEARATGLDPKVLKRAIKIARMENKDKAKYEAEEALLGLYLNQLTLPL